MEKDKANETKPGHRGLCRKEGLLTSTRVQLDCAPKTCPGPAEAAMPRTPPSAWATQTRAPAPGLPLTAPQGRVPPGHCRGREPRSSGGRERAGWKAAPHPVPSPPPSEPRPRGQRPQGCQARSPSLTPSSTRGSALHTCQQEGPARGPVPPATRALPGLEELHQWPRRPITNVNWGSACPDPPQPTDTRDPGNRCCTCS